MTVLERNGYKLAMHIGGTEHRTAAKLIELGLAHWETNDLGYRALVRTR